MITEPLGGRRKVSVCATKTARDLAQIELSVFTQQCLNRYVSDLDALHREATAWAERRNAAQVGVDWQ